MEAIAIRLEAIALVKKSYTSTTCRHYPRQADLATALRPRRSGARQGREASPESTEESVICQRRDRSTNYSSKQCSLHELTSESFRLDTAPHLTATHAISRRKPAPMPNQGANAQHVTRRAEAEKHLFNCCQKLLEQSSTSYWIAVIPSQPYRHSSQILLSSWHPLYGALTARNTHLSLPSPLAALRVAHGTTGVGHAQNPGVPGASESASSAPERV